MTTQQVERFTTDYTATEYFAQASDGVVFTRIRARGPFGYRTSAWRQTELTGLPSDTRPSSKRARLPR